MEIVDETLRRKFEPDWLTGSQPEIADYVPSQGSQVYLPTLEELICIDLEFSWTQSNSPTTRDKNALQTPPLLEDCLCKYPELGDQDIVRRLIDQEILARLNSDNPPTHKEYTQRFPGIEILESTFRLSAAQQSIEALLSTGDVSNALAAWNVMSEKLIRRLDDEDHSPDVVRVRMRQRGLISLGQGDRSGAKEDLSAALDAWETAMAQPESASLKTPEWTKEWKRLEELRNSIGQK